MNAAPEPAVWFPAIRCGTGADVFTERLCDGLNARGLRAEITWLPLRAEYAPWTVAVPRPPSWANVVHVNSWLPRHFWPRGLPIVATVHHLVHDPVFAPYRSRAQAAYHNLLIRRRELRAIRDASTVTTDSTYVRDTIEAFSGRRSIDVVHLWVDADKFRPGTAINQMAGDPFRLFMAGSMSTRKGFDLLPMLVKALGPGFSIHYAGGVATSAAIEGVAFLGRISKADLIREYQQCDAVVSLSRYEGFGYTALEAMACGKPFFGFRTSSLPEVVGEGCGVLVPLDDVQTLAEAIRRARGDIQTRIDMGARGRARALERFSARNMDAYVTIYAACA